MTPLIAGIALQGSPPMYEGFIKAKDAAKAKADAEGAKRKKSLEDMAYDGFDFKADTYHPHYSDKAAETYLSGMSSILESVDPNDPHAEQKVMYMVTDLQKKLAGYKGASDVLFNIEKSAWQDGHIVPEEFISWANQSRFGDEVPVEFQEYLPTYGIGYGQNPDGTPMVQVNSGLLKQNDYIKPFQTQVNRMQGEWEAMTPSERKALGNARIDISSTQLPYGLAQPILEDMSSDQNAVLNILKSSGIDIRTEDGKRRFYENYNPSKKEILRGSVGGGGGNGSPTAIERGGVGNRSVNVYPRAGGEFSTNYNNVNPALQVSATFDSKGGFSTGEGGSKHRRLGTQLQGAKVVSYGQVPIYNGSNKFYVPPVNTEDGETVGPFDVNPGDPVPDRLYEYISDGNVKGVSVDDISDDWYFLTETSVNDTEKGGIIKQSFIPLTKENAMSYLLKISNKAEQRAEAERLRSLNLIDGEDMNKVMTGVVLSSGGARPAGTNSPSTETPKKDPGKKPNVRSFFRKQ